MPYEYQDAAQIVNDLQSKGAEIEKWFAQREEPLELVVQNSVGGNTFRAFRNTPLRPSVVFREWALRELTDDETTTRLYSVPTQAAFDEWHQEFCSSFRQEWKERMGEVLPYGASRKLPDLLLKHFVWWTGLNDGQRRRLLTFLHVPLDSFTLVGVRNCIEDPEIPADAAMKFVAGPTMYNQIQDAIRAITDRAKVPAVYYDVLAWRRNDRR